MSVEKRVLSVLRDQLGIPVDRLTPNLFIMGEIDSPEHVELIMVLEEQFDITIPDEDADGIQTVAQVIRYVEERIARDPAGRTKRATPYRRRDPLWDRDMDG